jgi:Zn-dependent protease with chaperone function
MRVAAAQGDPLEDWARLAHQLSGNNPAAYTRRIVALAVFGAVILHSVWIVSALATLSLVGLAIWLRGWSLLLVAAPMLLLTGSWLWMLIHSEQVSYGVALNQKNAPALIEMISQVALQLGAPVPTRVELVPDFNAWVRVHRRPWGEWHLCLGLPLMLGTDVSQFKAIVGHELGHFVAGTPGARLVWSQQASWYSTLEMLGDSGLGRLVRGAFRAWGLRFQAEAVAMARSHERSADDAGAKVAGTRAAAEALIVLELMSRALDERFWPGIWRMTDAHAPEDVFVRLRHFLASLDREDVDRYYRSAIRTATLTFDVHPSISDRIAHLGQKPSLPAPVAVSAAQALLGAQLDPLSRELGFWWSVRVAGEWGAERAEATEFQQRLATSAKQSPNDLHPADALLTARALRWAGRLSEALPFYRRGASLNSDEYRARLGLGLALLETGDPTGLTELKLGVNLSGENPEAVTAAFNGARRFLEARGEPEKNPFTAVAHRLRLKMGRLQALNIWNRRAAL